MKKIVHIDLNAFFIQVESILDPKLNEVPAVVAYNSNRSVISTSNYLARSFGINSGMPLGLAKGMCSSLVVVNPKYHLYSEYSHRFIEFLKTKTKLVEQVSIDEAFLDLSEYLLDGKENEMLFDLQMEIYKKTNLKCSIGYSYTKYFAKLASDYKKPLGLTLITKDNYKDIVYPLSINKVNGLGKKTCEYLSSFGINTVSDLLTTKDENIINYLGSRYNEFVDYLNGRSSDIVSSEKYVAKSISTERTLSIDEEDINLITELVEKCSLELIKQLKKNNEIAYGLTIKIRTNDFKTFTKKRLCNKPLTTSEIITINAMNLFEELNIKKPIRLVGLKLDKLISNDDILENNKDTETIF